MNVTELARRMRMNTATLLEILPEFGFDIGKRAIKVDDRIAQKILRQSKYIKEALEKRKEEEAKKRKELERQMRQEKGESVVIPDRITVREFADRLGLPVTTIIAELMKNGILANLNENIDRDTATVLAEDLGFIVQQQDQDAQEVESEQVVDSLETALGQQDSEAFVARPPVVVVMGHVDHGKTSLLDAVRKTNVIAGESGGITQHIGAYQVDHTMKEGGESRKVTFVDTPGHEAFTVMRSRGARVADIAILVVAADDGVMPQTVEAIDIINAAKLPMVVAINKMDKEGANPEKVKTELSQRNIVPEEWGGKVPMVQISAKEGTNIDALLETVLLMADVHEEAIVADPDHSAVGTVVESHVDKGEGPVATILVQAGTLRRGDVLAVNGQIYGTVRAMKDFRADDVKEAGPSMPVKILGFKAAPSVGDILDVAAAKDATKIKKTKTTSKPATVVAPVSSSDEDEEDEGKKKMLYVVLKADVLGSLEAILASIEKFVHDEVGVKVVGKGLGNITEAEIDRATSTGAQVFAFHVAVPPSVKDLAKDKEVVVQRFEVIYKLLEYIEAELQKLLPSERIVHELGHATVKAIFRKDKSAMTVGSLLEDGKFTLEARVRIKRGGEVIGDGKIESLQIGASKEKEIPAGTEFGMRVVSKTGIEEGDILEAYTEEVKQRKIEFKHVTQE